MRKSTYDKLVAKARDADIVATAAYKRGDYEAYLRWAAMCSAFHKKSAAYFCETKP